MLPNTNNIELDQAATPVSVKRQFSSEEAKQAGDGLGISWDKYDIEQFTKGMNVELEHGRKDPKTDVTHDEPTATAKIALAHLNEIPDYYTRLAAMENDAERIRTMNRRKSH